MIDRIEFFDRARTLMFKGSMTQDQMNGCHALIGTWESRALSDVRNLACIIGQVYWETDRTMKPIDEYGRGVGRAYGQPAGPFGHIYYGRGLIQLTWYDNYVKMGRAIDVDLARFPDMANNLDIAVRIAFDGMLQGLFTGLKLGDFIKPGIDMREWDWRNQRRIVNGLDHADEIADICKQFWYCLGGPGVVRVLRIGCIGTDVEQLQQRLHALGFNVSADGDFGRLTQSAVIAFQRGKGIGVDGEVGPQTRKALGL